MLIILAAVAINLSLGNNGIFNRAKNAKEQYQNATEYEETQIAKSTNEIDSYVGGNRAGIASNNYSLDEQQIGTWIDGKPLYQKTISFTPTASTETIYLHNIQNIDKIFFDFEHSYLYTDSVSCYWYAKTGNDNNINAHYWSFVWAKKESFSIIVGKGIYTLNPSGYITFQYTKTTD